MQKIITKEDFHQLVKEDVVTNQKVVFTNGCFDLLHPGHIDYLKKARAKGDILVVGLNSDESVSRLKGSQRPINNYEFRSRMLAAFDFVNFVIKFDEDTPKELIEYINPQVLVKGGDYQIADIIGYQHVINYGGIVETIPFLDGFSSTNIVDKIKGLK